MAEHDRQNADRAARSLGRAIPILGWLPTYAGKWFRADLLAGLSVWAVLVPEGMAYADLAGGPPEAGLYAAMASMLHFGIFAASRLRRD